MNTCHAEHTVGFTGKTLGRNADGAAWEPCEAVLVFDGETVDRIGDMLAIRPTTVTSLPDGRDE